jgi:hypothetical protein
MSRVTQPLSSNQPDSRVPQMLAVIQRMSIIAIMLVSGVARLHGFCFP